MNLTTQTLAPHSATSQVTSASAGEQLPVFDRYADSIMRGNERLYDAFEIHGVRDLLAGTGSSDTCYEVDDVNPQSFSVYAHQVDGGVDAVGDFDLYHQAADYARELSGKYGLAVHDFVPDTHKGVKALQ